MYTTEDFPTKKALKDAVAAGRHVGVYQPNDMFNNTEKVQKGTHDVTLEGPHWPKPHRWYARVTVVDGRVTRVR